MRYKLAILPLILFALLSSESIAQENFRRPLYGYDAYTREAFWLFKRNRYYDAARYFFQAGLQKVSAEQKAVANARVSNALAAEGLYESASYFFLKAIGSGYTKPLPIALESLPLLVRNLGGGAFKKYILKYTRIGHFKNKTRDYYRYYLGQQHLLENRPRGTINVLGQVSSNFALYPQALQIRGSAYLIANKVRLGLNDFKQCVRLLSKSKYQKFYGKQEIQDLKNRCIAGVARGYYQIRNFKLADEWYDQVEIESMVWPQVQYERAWNYVAQGKYNRALGKLVSYKSPVLTWFLNSEVELLRALSYLQLCLYDDVNNEIDLFVKSYGRLGVELKNLLRRTARSRTKDLVSLYNYGLQALRKGVHTDDVLLRFMNRFVRSPYFIRLTNTDIHIEDEIDQVRNMRDSNKRGLGGFLMEVLAWKKLSSKRIGGHFIQQRLDTEYRDLLKNVQTMDIVKLEMLRRAKRKLVDSDVNASVDRFGNSKRGSLGIPDVRNNQYYWDFNGEFWADELGDYVFALRPECG